MSFFFSIHQDNPQARLLRQAVDIIKKGGVLVYPSDSGYALACKIGNKSALNKIQLLRNLGTHHFLSIVSHDLLHIANYAKISPSNMCILRAFTPGCYTFVLSAKAEVPVNILHPTRNTLSVKIPNHPVAQALLEYLHEPLISTTLSLPGMDLALCVPETIRDVLGMQVDLIIDAGVCDVEPTTVIDLTGDKPVILRYGKGDTKPFE